MPLGTSDRIVGGLPSSLGIPSFSTLKGYDRSGFAADYAIGGMPWLSAATDDNPLSRVTTSYQRERVDQSQSAGDQSLSNWWLRSATSWHKGAGLTYYDGEDDQLHRFRDSYGVDVWTQGQLKLLDWMMPCVTDDADGGVTKFKSLQSGGILLATSSTWSGHSGQLFKLSATGMYGLGDPWDVTNFCTDGVNVYYTKTDGLYKLSKTNVITKLYDAPGGSWTVQVCEYVKDRIMVGAQVTDALPMRLFELSRNPGGTLPLAVSLTNDSRFENESTDMRFNAVSELTGAIIFATTSGYVDSKVWSMTIATTTDGNVTVLEPVTVAQFPTNETVRCIESYLGTYLAIGTSRGLRIGTEASNGVAFTYGPLQFRDDVKAVAFIGDYLYASRGVGKGSDLKWQGLWRVDLGQQTTPGFYAYAADMSVNFTESEPAGVTNVTAIGALGGAAPIGVGKGAIIVGTTGGFLTQQVGKPDAEGELFSGQIRFSTGERKQPVSVTSRIQTGSSGNLVVKIGSPGGVTREFSSFTIGELTDWSVASIVPPASSFEVSLKLIKGGSYPNYTTPVIEEWQLRALPAPVKSRTITIPLQCNPEEMDSVGNSNPADPYTRLKALEDLEASGSAVYFQDFTTGESRTAIIRAVQFEQKSPPSFRDGFAGTVTVQLQTVDAE